jgi:hypothetical protein
MTPNAVFGKDKWTSAAKNKSGVVRNIQATPRSLLFAFSAGSGWVR